MMTTNRLSIRAVFLTLSIGLAGCASTLPTLAPAAGDDDVAKLLSTFAKQAVTARQQLAASKINADDIKRADPRGGNAAFDVDYIGPLNSIVEAVALKAGWNFRVLGPKRDDIIVTLYHVRVSPIVILQDAGEQCNGRCEVQVEIVPNGKSEVTITYKADKK